MIGALGTLLPVLAQESQDHDFETSKNLEIFNAIYRNLDMAYVDTLSAGQTIGTGINAMLQSLDPYTVYYPAEKVSELKASLTRKVCGYRCADPLQCEAEARRCGRALSGYACR